MELIYKGKTKDVYEMDGGNVLLKFKDDVTGEDGVFDPGANTVGLTIEGAGKSGLRMTTHFFEKLIEKNIPTHFVDSNIDEVTMTVKKAEMFGRGLEVICRYRAVGSFLKRFGAYCEEGQPLNAFVEVTLKDDDRKDPPINQDGLSQLGILSIEDYKKLEELTKEISGIVKDELALKGLELYDIKLEFGRHIETNEIMLIDEISGGNMRVYKNGVYISPMELEKLVLA
ncbi:phosphoribosylaminoimidazolesuccinocarboxamide synthase [Sporosarcina siberiensis]|uniref:phosphoribosylaminoimidazolesuccinocarboxamide synthase n=1 Tax=Sporosarcina siberiensis TaxID=1365606 RepID=A0ABW4SMV9_9BACL